METTPLRYGDKSSPLTQPYHNGIHPSHINPSMDTSSYIIEAVSPNNINTDINHELQATPPHTLYGQHRSRDWSRPGSAQRARSSSSGRMYKAQVCTYVGGEPPVHTVDGQFGLNRFMTRYFTWR